MNCASVLSLLPNPREISLDVYEMQTVRILQQMFVSVDIESGVRECVKITAIVGTQAESAFSADSCVTP